MDLVARFHEQGPAATTTSLPPIVTPRPKSMMVPSGLNWRLAKLKGLSDAHDLAHAIEQFEIAMIKIAMYTNSAQDGVRFAGGAMNIKATSDKAVDDVLDLTVGGSLLHYDDHG